MRDAGFSRKLASRGNGLAGCAGRGEIPGQVRGLVRRWSNRQKDGAAVGDGDRMFEVGAWLRVERGLRPMVTMHFHALRAHVHHWFYGDDEPGFDAEVAAAAEGAAEEIGDLRLFVHLAADAVADEALNRGEAVVADELGHFAGDL